ATVLKTVMGWKPHRGFESHALRVAPPIGSGQTLPRTMRQSGNAARAIACTGRVRFGSVLEVAIPGSRLAGQPLRIRLVDRVELVAADLSGRAVHEVAHGVEAVGLEDAHAARAVRAGDHDGKFGSAREWQLAAPESCRIGH